MKNKVLCGLCIVAVAGMLFAGCGSTDTAGNEAAPEVSETTETVEQTVGEDDAAVSEETEAVAEAVLPDGVYTVSVDTGSPMFHINEAYDETGTLTVTDGEMTLHITLPSKSIVNLYPGSSEEAQAEGAVLLEPTTDSVTYSDGITEEVYGFDIPVPYLDEAFPVAIIGTHENWYDHEVVVSDPVAE